MANSGFDESVSITRFLMNTAGIWPNSTLNNWYSRYRFLVPTFFMVFFINIPQTRKLMLVWGNLNDILEILITADIMIGLAAIKLIGIWYNKQDLKYLLVEMETDWKLAKKHKQRIMWENVRLSRVVTAGYSTAAYLTIIIYSIRMLILLKYHSTYEDFLANASTPKPMFVNSRFFFETQSSPVFEIIWISQCLACFIGVSVFLAFDGFFIFSIMHLCSQLTNLQFDLKHVTFLLRKSNFREVQRSIIKKHIHLKKFTYYIEDNFNKTFLLQMICYSVTLCLQGYQLVTILTATANKTSIAELGFIVCFTTANLFSLFLYCFVAEKLRSESSNLFHAAYEMNWYELRPQESKMILLIMHATKSPLKITAGKFAALSLEYFVKVLKTAAGYLSMLLAVKSSDYA